MPIERPTSRRPPERPVAKGWLAALPIIVFLIFFTTISFGMAFFAYQNGAPWIFVLGAGGIGVVGLCFGANGAYAAYLGRRSHTPAPPAPPDTDTPAPSRSTGFGSPSPCAYCGRVVPADQIACPECGSAIER